MTTTRTAKSMDDIVSLCKRRGFIYPDSEIYGGLNGFWDYGPLGVELKNNLRDRWWRDMVKCPPIGPDGEQLSIVGLDSAIIHNPKVWEASGHVDGFNDPMVDCRETKERYRHDHLFVYRHRDVPEMVMFAFVEGDPEVALKKIAKSNHKDPDAYDVVPLTEIDVSMYDRVVGPNTKTAGTLTEPRLFNLMFMTYVGAIQTGNPDDNKAYLRPETAQGIFLNYKNVLDTMRVRVPFGIAQIGKAFRNEVTPRNFIFRSREFEQMEVEWFCHPDDSTKWYEFWRDERLEWWRSLGITSDALILREHARDELAHYSTVCADVEYQFPFTAPGYGELEGVAHRGCYDLTKHQEHSKTKLEYFDQERNERYLPHVIEPSAGLSRGTLVLLCEAFTPDPERPSKVYMKFDPKLAPLQVGVFPLVNKDGMPEAAEKLYLDLRETWSVQFDVKQNIGKRYARMDEVGTPYCFTIDAETLENGTVTCRHRDTTAQERIAMDQVRSFLAEKIG